MKKKGQRSNGGRGAATKAPTVPPPNIPSPVAPPLPSRRTAASQEGDNLEIVQARAVTWAMVSGIANAVMAAASVAGAIFVVMQLQSVAESNRLQARSIELSNRPWVWVKSATLESLSPEKVAVKLKITNTGHSLGEHLKITASTDLNEQMQATSVQPFLLSDGLWPGGTIGPGQEMEGSLTFRDKLSPEQVEMIENGKVRLIVRQILAYEDEFSDDERKYPICLYYIPKTKDLAFCNEPLQTGGL